MKKSNFLIGFVFILVFGALFSVKCQVSVSQEFVDDAAKAFALVVAQRDEIAKNEQEKADLRKLAAELEKASRTPCTIAANQVKTDLTYWFEKLSGDKAKDKVVNKILKDARKSGRAAIASQCNFKQGSDFMNFLKIASGFAPLLILLK